MVCLLEKNVKALSAKRKRVLDLYATGSLSREEYTEKSREYDNEEYALRGKQIELHNQVPLLHKKELVDTSLAQYCETAKQQFKNLKDFTSKRQFLLDHIDRVIVAKNAISIYGYVSVRLKAYDDPDQPSDAGKIWFCIEQELNRPRLIAKLKENEDTLDGIKITWKEHDAIETCGLYKV